MKPDKGVLISNILDAEREIHVGRERLADLVNIGLRHGILTQEAVKTVDGEIRFERDAKANRANVLANRVREFAVSNRDELRRLLSLYAFNRGLTGHDVEDMWTRIVGDPKPIVVEPEPSFTEFIDQEDDE